MSGAYKETVKGWGFISPWVAGFMLFMLVPIGMSLYYSLCDYKLLQPPVFIGFDNYAELWNDKVFWIALKNTLKYAAMALPASLLVSLGLALLLNVKIPGQALFRTIIFLPSLVPLVASAMVWLWLFNSRFGLLNSTVKRWGLDFTISMDWYNQWAGLTGLDKVRDLDFPPNWLGDDRFALMAIAFMSLWGVGHTVVIFLAGLQDVPRELYEAAEIDGASTLRRLWHVTLPWLSPVIFFNLIMAILGTLQVFAVPYIMTGGGPDRATYFYTMYLYDNAFNNNKMGYASAMAWIQFLMVLALTGLAFWTSKRWVHYQGK